MKLFPVYHPAAALYTPSNLRSLEADFDKLPALLGLSQTQALIETENVKSDASVEINGGKPEPEQLGLF